MTRSDAHASGHAANDARCVACGEGIPADPAFDSGHAPAATLAQSESPTFMRCPVCGLGQRLARPSDAELDAMYACASVSTMEYPYESNVAWSRSRSFLRDRFSGSSQVAVLDIGCHTGDFLGGLPGHWRKCGIEMGAETARTASERHGVELIGHSLQTVDATWDGAFDAVTMFDVVEHLPDPLRGISAATRWLKPGGVLLLSSGDLDAWTWRWLGWGHWYLDSDQHLNVVSKRFLAFVARESGLELTRVESIPHRRANWTHKFREAARLVYWGMRIRGGWLKGPYWLMQNLPGLRRLRHMNRVPWSMSLADHLWAQFTAGAVSAMSNRKDPTV